MACPIITGKGYTFSSPVITTGNVGEDKTTTAEFTAIPQEGFFLRADHFYVNSGSDFISDVTYTQDGDNVTIVATLDVDMWPGEDTSIDLDLEYLYLDGTGLDPILREKKITILPVDNSNVSTFVGTTELTETGMDINLSGVCGEAVALPTITVVPGDGLDLLDGADDVSVNVSGDGVSLTPTVNSAGNVELDGSYTFDELDSKEGTGDSANDIDVNVLVESDDLIEDGLVEPTAEEIGLSIEFDNSLKDTEGGPVTVNVYGAPNTDIEYTVLDCNETAVIESTVVSVVDSTGCPSNETVTSSIEDVALRLDGNGEGVFNFTIPVLASGCCTYRIQIKSNSVVVIDEGLTQCVDLQSVLNLRIFAPTELHGIPNVPRTIETETGAPGSLVAMEEHSTAPTAEVVLPSSGGQWVLGAADGTMKDILDEDCWTINGQTGHPRDIFKCVEASAIISGNDLHLTFNFTEGTMPAGENNIELNLDCFAHDPQIPTSGTPDATLVFKADVRDSDNNSYITTGPFVRRGIPGTAIPDTSLVFDVTGRDGFTWLGSTPSTITVSPTTYSASENTSVSTNFRIFATLTGSFPSESEEITYTVVVDQIEEIEEIVEETPVVVMGCTDPTAENYNPDATEDDGSCTLPPPPPAPEFSTTVNIVNEVPNTTLTTDSTFTFGPHIVGTQYDGTITIQSNDGYESSIGTVTATPDMNGILTSNSTAFNGSQQVGNKGVTITLTGAGPAEIVIPDPIFDCPVAMFDATVDADGNITGTTAEGSFTITKINGETFSGDPMVDLDGQQHTITAEITIPGGYQDAGLTMECTDTVTAPDAPDVAIPIYSDFYTAFNVVDNSGIEGLTFGGSMNLASGTTANNIPGTPVPSGDTQYQLPFGIENRNNIGVSEDEFNNDYNILGRGIGGGQLDSAWGGRLVSGFEIRFEVPEGIDLPQYGTPQSQIAALGLTGILVRPTTPGTNIAWDFQEFGFAEYFSSTRQLLVKFDDIKDGSGNTIPFTTVRNTAIGEYLNYGANQWEVTLQGDTPTIPSYIRTTDSDTGNPTDPRGVVKFYRGDVLDVVDDNSLNPDDYLIDDIYFNGPLVTSDYKFNEGDVSSNIIYAIIDDANYLSSGSDADLFTSMTAKDQDGNVISSSNDDLAAWYYSYSGLSTIPLEGILTGESGTGRMVALRWQNINTIGVNTIYWDVGLKLGSTTPIPKQAMVKFNFIAGDDSPFKPYNHSTGLVDETITYEISGLAGTAMNASNITNICYYGIPDGQSTVYPAGGWIDQFRAPEQQGYWTDRGFTLNLIQPAFFNQFQNYVVEFKSYTPDGGAETTNVNDDPYPGIGYGLEVDDTAKTVTERRRGIEFGLTAQTGVLSSPFDGIYSCEDSQAAYIRAYGRVAATFFDSRGGVAEYNVYVKGIEDASVAEFGTLLYTDENSNWMGSTVDGTTVSIGSYDWGTQPIETALSAQTFELTTDRGYPAITANGQFDVSLIERAYSDACSGVGTSASTSEIAISIGDKETRNTIYGDRGKYTITVADGSSQLNSRDVVLDLNISGDNEPLEEATFTVTLVDNMANSTVSVPATYLGYATERYPDNTSLVVSAIAADGYSFDSNFISTTVGVSGTGVNSTLIESSDITLDFTTVPGQILVISTPVTGQNDFLVGGHTDIELTLAGVTRPITAGPPYEDGGEFSRTVNFNIVDTGDFSLPNHKISPNEVEILYFNPSDQNSENNETYSLTLSPQSGESYANNLPTVGQFAVFTDNGNTTFPSENYEISNIRIDDSNRSIVFDFKFTYQTEPSSGDVEIWFGLPDELRTQTDFVNVQYTFVNNISGTTNSETTALIGSLNAGGIATATFDIFPSQYHTLEGVDISKLSINEDSPESPDGVPILAPIVLIDTPNQRGKGARLSVSYDVTTDDVTRYTADGVSDNTIEFEVQFSGTEGNLQSRLVIVPIDHKDATVSTEPFEMVYNCGDPIPNPIVYNPVWTIDSSNSLHWQVDGNMLTDIITLSRVSGNPYLSSFTLTSSGTPGGDRTAGTGFVKVHTANLNIPAGSVVPEDEVVTYSMSINTDPGDDTITGIGNIPSVIPANGENRVLTISNGTGTGVVSATITSPGTAEANDPVNNTYAISIPVTTAIEDEDTRTFTTTPTTEFGSTYTETLPQQIKQERDWSGAILRTLRIIYNIDVPNTTVTTSQVNASPDNRGRDISSSTISGSGNSMIHTVSYIDFPGRLDGTQIDASALGSLINLSPTSPFTTWSSTPESDGEVTFNSTDTSIQRTDINGRKIWDIPNTNSRGQFFQDKFDAPVNGTVQNTSVYDYHPTSNSDVEINVSGTGPGDLPSFYDCDQFIDFNMPTPINGRSQGYAFVDLSTLFKSGGNLMDVSDTGNSDPWIVGLTSIGRVQRYANYSLQLMYGDFESSDLSRVGVFTTTGWVGVDDHYNGIYTQPTSGGLQTIWDVTGFYGYDPNGGYVDGDTSEVYLIENNSVRFLQNADFDPSFHTTRNSNKNKSTSPNPDISEEVSGVGPSPSLASFTSQLIPSRFNLNEAVQWWDDNIGNTANRPQYFVVRIIGAAAGNSVDQQIDNGGNMDFRLRTECSQLDENVSTEPIYRLDDDIEF